MFVFSNRKRGMAAVFVLAAVAAIDVAMAEHRKRAQSRDATPLPDFFDEELTLAAETTDGKFAFPKGARVYAIDGRELSVGPNGLLAEPAGNLAFGPQGDERSVDVAGTIDAELEKRLEAKLATAIPKALEAAGLNRLVASMGELVAKLEPKSVPAAPAPAELEPK